MVKGLKSGNAALVTAAAEEMHANAADVGGNQLTVDGGTYNTDGLTALDVLNQGPTGPLPALLPAALPATAVPAAAAGVPAAASAAAPRLPRHSTGSGNSSGSATSASLDTGVTDTHHFSIQHHVDHHGHLWG